MKYFIWIYNKSKIEYFLFEEKQYLRWRRKKQHKMATVQTQKAWGLAFGEAYRSRNETVSSLPLSKHVLGSRHRELGHSFGNLWNSEGYRLPATHALLVPRLQHDGKSKMLNHKSNWKLMWFISDCSHTKIEV